MNNKTAEIIPRQATPTPAPMPALAPVESWLAAPESSFEASLVAVASSLAGVAITLVSVGDDVGDGAEIEDSETADEDDGDSESAAVMLK